MLHFEIGNLYEVCEIANPLILVDIKSRSFRSINEKCLFMDSVSGKIKSYDPLLWAPDEFTYVRCINTNPLTFEASNCDKSNTNNGRNTKNFIKKILHL